MSLVSPLPRHLPACACLLAAMASLAETLPPETRIQVRLQSKVTSASKPGDKVEAAVIAPVVVENRTIIAAGSQVIGAVKAANPAKPDARADLTLELTQVACPGEAGMPLAAKLTGVDNARESV